MCIDDLVYQEDPTVIGAYTIYSQQDGDWRLRAAHRDQTAAYAHIACLTTLGVEGKSSMGAVCAVPDDGNERQTGVGNRLCFCHIPTSLSAASIL